MTRTHNRAANWIMCHRCGKNGHRGYHSRADARYVRKRHPGDALSIFRCPHTAGLFHLGHPPKALTSGRVDRATMTEQIRRATGAAA